MARWALRRRDTAMLEARRREAFALLEAGERPAAVARQLGVSAAAVSHWRTTVRAGGVPSLASVPRTGRPPKVSPETQGSLPTLLARGPAAYGLSDGPWTLARLGHVVRREWGISYSRSAIWRLLRSQGFHWGPGYGTAGRPGAGDRGRRPEWNRSVVAPRARRRGPGTVAAGRGRRGQRRFSVVGPRGRLRDDPAATRAEIIL